MSQRAPEPSAAPDARGSETSRPRLHQAVLTGTSAADLEQLVRSGDGHVNQPDPDGLLALHALCAEGCWEEELQAYVVRTHGSRCTRQDAAGCVYRV